MNRFKPYIITVLIIAIGSFPATANVADQGKSLRGKTPIQLFMGTCVIGRQSLSALEEAAKRKGFSVAPTQTAQNYLRGNGGKAWFLENEEGRFGLARLENNLCSVYVHQGEIDTIQASMEAWLPPAGSGFSYKKELVSQSGSLTTTSYTLYQGSRFLEQWVLTINSAKSTNLVAIMSYQGA